MASLAVTGEKVADVLASPILSTAAAEEIALPNPETAEKVAAAAASVVINAQTVANSEALPKAFVQIAEPNLYQKIRSTLDSEKALQTGFKANDPQLKTVVDPLVALRERVIQDAAAILPTQVTPTEAFAQLKTALVDLKQLETDAKALNSKHRAKFDKESHPTDLSGIKDSYSRISGWSLENMPKLVEFWKEIKAANEKAAKPPMTAAEIGSIKDEATVNKVKADVIDPYNMVMKSNHKLADEIKTVGEGVLTYLGLSAYAVSMVAAAETYRVIVWWKGSYSEHAQDVFKGTPPKFV